MVWRRWIVDRWFGDLVEARVREAVSFMEEDQGWRSLGGVAGRDVSFHTLAEQMANSADAYRESPLAFRIVELTTDYVLGRGVRLRSADHAVQAFVDEWWAHPQNRMAVRQFELCTELSLSGELFVTLHPNPYDGMAYVRMLPAATIDLIETDPEDVERELRFHQLSSGSGPLEGTWWGADQVRHYAINRLAGAVRGQGDLVPMLLWLRRYRDWLTDRVRMNKFKGAFLWDVEVRGADHRAVLARQAALGIEPTPGSIMVHNESEQWRAVQPQIDAQGAEPDGRAMRLMIAAGAGVPLHFLAEGEGANRATAAEMGGPTLRHFERRQLYVGWVLADLALEAARRSGRFGDGRSIAIEAEFEDLSARENAAAAAATRSIVEALAVAADRGWVDAETARRMIAKYSGEPVASGEATRDAGAARVGGRVVVTRGGGG
jgi:hypothetical protein